MVSFTPVDIAIILLFFGAVIFIGFYSSRKLKDDAESYLLSGRKVGLFLFVLTNVSTWYGGILGVGEFTYRYGLLSWFTQGFPYYVFAIVFAVFFAKKIRGASLYTIPDKLEEAYGKKVGVFSGVLIFILVSPAPYLLMIGNLVSLIFSLDLFISLIIGILLSTIYLFKGGYKSDIFTDALEFFVMFAGFIVIFVVAYMNLGGIEYLRTNLPEDHLDVTGGASPTYIIVWFLIALWTFTDPGFHQRCYAAKSGSVAVKGMVISVIFWAAFDFLTNTTGLYSRAMLKEIENPVLAFPLFAEEILGSGLKGIFYAALFATILSTLNSFLFLSATTFGRDFLYKLSRKRDESKLTFHTRLGILIAAILSILLAYFIQSVVNLWYTIGSICIPGLILPIIGAYYERFKVTKLYILVELIVGISTSILWLILRPSFPSLTIIEPMIVGLVSAAIVHGFGILGKHRSRIVS
jgi:SSS family solute:Na+ symporter